MMTQIATTAAAAFAGNARPEQPPAPATAILSNVSMSYDGKLEVLHDIDFTLRDGEFLSIVGPSGCGKSTILRLISGLAAPSKGRIEVKERGDKPAQIGFMFQRDALLPWATVWDNIAVGLECGGVPKEQYAPRIKSLLQLLGLAEFGHYYPRALSGGMRQRVALARTLCTEPDVVLLDEPFAALDSQTRLALSDEIAVILRREKKTAILVTHDIGEAVSMAERVIVLSRRPGRVKSDHAIRFAGAHGTRPTPLSARNAAEFNGYFNALWQELEVHVEG
jgi:NitT/TauT family transport system ATP-binding protein